MAEKKYDRGSLLSIFKSDRAEDVVALIIALLIVLGVLITIPK
jgi:hypothetical protein